MAGDKAAPDDLGRHIESTYHGLRIGILVIGALLPLLLWVGGSGAHGVPLRASMSAYYYTGMRDVFVGALCAIGVALFVYKGFSRAEHRTLSLAGVLVVCVALFPTRSGSQWTFASVVHAVAALGFFACLAYVSVFRASDTLSLVRDTTVARGFQRWYRILGVAMIASPVLAVVFALLVREPGGALRLVFFLEMFGVWAFAAYWGVKSREIRATSADFALARGVLLRVPPTSVPGRLIQTAALDDDSPTFGGATQPLP